MLDREESAALAEIEAALRRDDPELVSMLELFRHTPSSDGAPELFGSPADLTLSELLADAPDLDDDLGYDADLTLVAGPVHRWRRRVAAVIAAVVALAATLAVTVALGPDAGGFTGVVTTMAATMFGYQILRGCPGRR